MPALWCLLSCGRSIFCRCICTLHCIPTSSGIAFWQYSGAIANELHVAFQHWTAISVGIVRLLTGILLRKTKLDVPPPSRRSGKRCKFPRGVRDGAPDNKRLSWIVNPPVASPDKWKVVLWLLTVVRTIPRGHDCWYLGCSSKTGRVSGCYEGV